MSWTASFSRSCGEAVRYRSRRYLVTVCLYLSANEDIHLEPPPCKRALVYEPDRVRDPYLDDGSPPARVAQLYFSSLSELEAAALGIDGAWRAEAMEVYEFKVPQGGEARCTYLVAYAGPADDEKAWQAHYLAHHPPIMARLPGIRELEVSLPLEWRCPPGMEPVRHMQRNKVAFDSAEALEAALASPIRAEMREDYARLPRFTGRVTHFAMTTRVLR
jgi:uncharacterized protein (TIGR02118 family)